MRLRIINGSATTYFHLEYAGGPMTIISADGLAVQPMEAATLFDCCRRDLRCAGKNPAQQCL